MPDALPAVLFADVSGSTALYGKLGDRGALAAVDSVLQALRRATEQAGGRVIKTIGDEIMSVFPSAAAAVRAARGMQTAVDALPAFGGARLGVRIGLHAGPILEERGDVFGDAVNTAARMTRIANAGQIMTTLATVRLLPEAERAGARDLDRLPVKGKQVDVSVCELLWQDSEDLTVQATRIEMAGEGIPRLRLVHGGAPIVMGPEMTSLLIGRDAASDVVIAHRSASRLHGRIDRRRDKYFYVDLSTNGTFVAIPGEPELLLRREEIMLRGRGRLAYGHPASDARAEIVDYAVEG